MARISTYGITAPPLLGDKVIGTDVNGTPADATKNFTVESIAALAGTEGLVTLTQVLTANNTANDLSIVLTGTGSLTALNATITGTLSANGGTGLAGQILSSQGASPAQWIDHDTLNPDLQEVLDVGNSAFNTDLILSGSGELTAWGLSIGLGGSTFLSNVTFGSTITAGGVVGVAGQVLTSQGAGVSPQWLNDSTPIPTITQVLNAGDNAGGNDITFLNSISTDNIVASGAVGVLGQLMQSTGGGITWVSSVNLTTVQTDNLIIDGGTITADGSTGTAGQVLASTVTGVEWVAAGGGGGGLTWVQKTAAYTAVDGDMVGTRLVSTGYTISPPTSPALGMRFGVQDMSNLGNTYNITIDFNTQGTRWNSQASDLVLTKDSFCVIFEWVSVQVGWALVGGGIQ
tara:strand:+ start:361 stop:1566 length:1206 start_codon:yes stop_codon:yes gene_type:complete